MAEREYGTGVGHDCRPGGLNLPQVGREGISTRVSLFPLYFFQVYLSLTVLLYAFGPWPWPTQEPGILYGFLLLVQVAFWLGYRLGVPKVPCKYVGPWSMQVLVSVSLILNMVWIVPSFMSRSGATGFSLGGMLESALQGLYDPGSMYAARMEALATVEKTTLFGYLSQVVSPILWFAIPLAIFFWKSLDRLKKIFLLIVVFFEIVSWVAIGTNKGLFDILIVVSWMVIAANPRFISSFDFRGFLKSAVLIIGGLVAVLYFFAIGQEGRGGGEIPAYDRSANIQLDYDNWLIAALPDGARLPFGAVASYLSQGYYPLSIALTEPPTFSYGVGHSHYYTGIVQSFVGQGVISDKTYPALIEKYGWDRYGKWHTMYTWMASDISFAGVIVFVFALGGLLAKVWCDVVYRHNPPAVALLALLCIMVFYFPANNQVLAFSRTANAFWVILVFWGLTRSRKA